jgi:parallel beta-helix repeat protein
MDMACRISAVDMRQMMVNYNVRKIVKIGIPLFFFFLVFIAGVVDVTAASTIIVSKTSPACTTGGDYFTSIQAAVDSANDGDDIVVCPGTYVENIAVDKNLTIRSMNGPDSTIVQAKDPEYPVFEVTVNYVEISGFTVNGAKGWLASGIHLHYADYCNISNNNCSNNSNDIYAQYSSNNNITDNICSNNAKGILLLYSNNNRISNNICSNKGHDIFLWDSKNNKLMGNDMVENGIFIEGDTLSDYTHEIDESNTVHGKPVYYWKDIDGGRVPDGAGQIILVNCTNVVVENQKLSNAQNGIQTAFSSYIALYNNTCSNNQNSGITLVNSSNSTIENNIVSNNGFSIYLNSSFNNIIKDNNILNNRFGIYLAYYSFNNTIEHNVAKSNYWDGFALYTSSDHNTIEDNIASNNTYGIRVSESDNNIIKNNTACENEGSGINLQDSSGNEISHNAVNNNVCGIELIYGYNNTITNNSVSCFFYSIELEHSYNNIMSGNIITNNKWGFRLHLHSFNNTLRNNVVKSNYFEGIELDSSSGNNTIVENIISNNGEGITVDSYSNIIKNNTVTSNDRGGIELLNSSYNSIKSNNANSNGEGGVLLSFNSRHNTVELNTANSNDCFGIKLENSSYNIIKNNAAKLNREEGIALYLSNNNIVKDNTANSNKKGLYLGGRLDIFENGVMYGTGSYNNSIENNVASNNVVGIDLYFSDNNTIKNNIASNNKDGITSGSSCNNTIKNNIASNNRLGIDIFFSNNNIMENNIASNNYGIAESGIYLACSKMNILKNNIVTSNNGTGIGLSGASYIILWNNNISLNHFSGIHIISLTNNNAFFHNNIIGNTIQVKAEDLSKYWYHPDLLEGNYWSDYNGTDTNGDGIGDTDIPHPDSDYDNYPFVNKSGWLTFLVSPEYWDFGTVYQGELVQKTFKMQNAFVYNKGKDELNILSINSEPDVDISDMVLPLKILKGTSKTFNVTIDTTNLEGHILRSLEIQSDDKITPNKTLLIYGIVKPPIHEVRIRNMDFQSRIIKGQISLFNSTIENIGDFREKNLTIEIKEGDISLGYATIKNIASNENKSAIVKWNTENASLGIHDITIEVLNEDLERLTDIAVRISVLAPSKAKTLIVTNLERLEEVENDLIMLSGYVSYRTRTLLSVMNVSEMAKEVLIWKSKKAK